MISKFVNINFVKTYNLKYISRLETSKSSSLHVHVTDSSFGTSSCDVVAISILMSTLQCDLSVRVEERVTLTYSCESGVITW